MQLLGPPVYSGDYTIEFTRSLAGQDVDQLAIDDSSVAGVSINTAQQGHVGDWTVDLEKNVQPGQSRTIQNLFPETTYQIRWEAVGYAPEDVTPGPPLTITTTPPEVDAMIAGAGDGGFVGQGVWSLDGDGESVAQSVMAGKVATYQIQVTNGEPTSDDFLITGPGSDANWTVSYFDAQGHDITAAVIGAGYTARGLGVGQTCALSVEVAPNQGVADGDTKEVLVTATIGSDTAQADAVLATTTAVTQTVAKLQYSLDDGTTWQDVPQPGETGYPLTVNQRTEVEFKAIKSNPDGDWPDGKPLWHGTGGTEGTTGETVRAYFDDYSHNPNDLKAVTAECHNNVTAQIKVTPKYAIYLFNDNGSDLNLRLLAGGSPANLAQSSIAAQVIDPDENPVPGVTVNFSTQYGDGTQAGQINNAGLQDDSAVTDNDGWATAALTSGAKVGDVIVKAMITAPNGEQIGAEGDVFFDPPLATVNFGGWVNDGNGQQHQQCVVAVTFNDQIVPNRIITLRTQVTDSAGNSVSADYQNAAQIDPTSLRQTDANGMYSTVLRWVPPATDPNANPNNYNITVFVDDVSITK